MLDREVTIAVGTDDAIEPVKDAFDDLYPNAIQTEGVPTNVYSDKVVFGWSNESGYLDPDFGSLLWLQESSAVWMLDLVAAYYNYLTF